MNIFDSNKLVIEPAFRSDLAAIIVTHNRHDLLETFIKSLYVALFVKTQAVAQVIICVNGIDEKTQIILQENSLVKEMKTQIISLNKAVTPAEARNIAVCGANSKWLIFLDDDVVVPDNLILNFEMLTKKSPEVSLWGGPNLTPLSSSFIEQKIGWLLQNYLVTGPISHRYKFNNIDDFECRGQYFSLCNMFVKTEDFKNILFNSQLKTAEENELIYKFSKNKLKMKASDLLYVWHYRRNTIPHFLKQINNYGYGRGQLIYNGNVSIMIPILFFLVIVLLSLALIKTPLLVLALAATWLSIIFIKLSLDFNFKIYNLGDVFLPIRLWLNYGLGLFTGLVNSYKTSKKILIFNK